MKKFLLAFLFLGATIFGASAQSRSSTKFSIGADLGVPTGVYDQIYNFVLGVSLKVEAPVSPSFSVMFTTGYTSFMVNSLYSNYGATNGMYLPLEVGGRGYFNSRVYFEGDLGPSFNLNQYYTGNKVEFMYSPGLGVLLPQSDGGAVDISVRYEGRAQTNNTLGQAALRIAYRFK